MWVNPKDYEILGECLAAVRRRAGVTQDELAARLQKPQSFISAYERGQRRVDVLELILIVRALDADPSAAFSEILEKSAQGRAE